jgi:hypothetical protein
MALRQKSRLRYVEQIAVVAILAFFMLALLRPENKFFHLMGADFHAIQSWYPNFPVVVFIGLSSVLPFLFATWIMAVASKSLKIATASSTSILAFFLAWISVNHLGPVPSIIGFVVSIVGFNGRQKALSAIRWSIKPIAIEAFVKPIGILMLVAVAVRIALVWLTDNSSEPDAACRILIAHIWSEYYLADANISHILNPNPDWPVLHFFFAGSLLKLGASIEIVRLFHAIVGVLASAMLYKVAMHFTTRPIALLAALVYLVYPASAVVSAQVMSEPLFLFVVLGSLHSFLLLHNSGQSKHLIALILWINAACLLRYEGWTLCGIYPLLYVLSVWPFRWQQFLLFGFSGLAALGICGLLVQQGFHPLRGILYSDEQVAYCFSQSGKQLAVFVNGYKAAWVPLAFGAFLGSIFIFRKNSIYVAFLGFVLLFCLPFLYKNITFGLFPQYRYLTYYMVLMMIPLAIVGHYLIQKTIGIRPITMVVLIGGLCALSFSGQRYISTGLMHFPKGFNASIAKVNTIPSGNFYLDHQPGVGAYHWIAATQMPLLLDYEDTYLRQHIDFETMRRVALKNGTTDKAIRFLVNDYESEFGTTDFERFHNLLLMEGDNYVMLVPNKPLSKHLGFTKVQETWRGIHFQQIFHDSGYQIYKVVP